MGFVGRWLILMLVAAAACADTSNLTGGEDIPTRDAGPKPDDSGGSQIDPDGAGPIVTPSNRCDPLKPFGAPALVTELDPEASVTKSAVLTPDELEVFYLRYTSTAGVWELRHARRGSTDAKWSAPVTDPMTPGAQGFLSITAAGKKLYFWTTTDNYRAVRSSTADTFGTPTKYKTAESTPPWAFIVESDDSAYFGKLVEGGGERFIHRASFDSFGFSTSKAITSVHVAGASDNRPVLNASETAMYFASNRPGGRGLDDVWVARRATKQDDFGPGIHVRELSSDDPDYVTWISDDDCVAMLDRASHVYVAKRPP